MPKIRPADSITNHPLYYVYKTILMRCYKTDHPAYKKYGAKGVTMCDEWRGDMMLFYRWAIAAGWAKGLHIDRRDGSKGYSPENCRFVTPLQNNRNRSCTVWIEREGVSKPLQEWGDEVGLTYNLLSWRLRKLGKDHPALFGPLLRVRKEKKKVG